MQRALNRVSKESNVTKNAPPTVQRKLKTAASRKAASVSAATKRNVSKGKSRTSSASAKASVEKRSNAISATSKEDAKPSHKKERKLAAVPEAHNGDLVGTSITDESSSKSSSRAAKGLVLEKVSKSIAKMTVAQEEAIDSNKEILEMNNKILGRSPRKEVKQKDDSGAAPVLVPVPETKDITKSSTPEPTVTADKKSAPDDDKLEGRDSRDITRKMIADILRTGDDALSFEFQGYDVPVSYSPAVDYDMALMATKSSPFLQWQNKMSNVIGSKRLEINHVEIHSVDFVDEEVDMIKMNAICAMIDDETGIQEEIASGVCYLRDNYVAFLLELFCIEDESSWSILVDNPRVSIGAVSALELPVGKVDVDGDRLLGYEIEQIEDAFGLELNMNELRNLSNEAYDHHPIRNEGMCPCPGQSGEQVKIMHLRKEISKDHLLLMRSKFSEKRDEGALVSLRVIPLADIWKVSADMKVMCALFLLEKANQAGYDSDDDASVSVRGLVTSMLSNVARPLTASSSYRCNEM